MTNKNSNIDLEKVIRVAQSFAEAVKEKYYYNKIILFGSFVKGNLYALSPALTTSLVININCLTWRCVRQ